MDFLGKLCFYLSIFLIILVFIPRHTLGKGKEKVVHKSTRLSKDILPYRYDLFVHPNLTTLDNQGKVDIYVKCMTETDKVIFHSRKLKLSNIRLVSRSGKQVVHIVHTTKQPEDDLVVLKLRKPLKKYQKYRLSMKYLGRLSKDMRGFYKSQYTTKSGEKRTLAVTNFEPVDARKAFPCFDEPEFKAKFKIKILRSKEHRSISNMNLEKSIETKHGHFVDEYGLSVKMSTYLVAYAVSDFEYRESKTKNGVQVRVWAKKDAIESTAFALDCAKHVITYFEEYFQIKYPLPKMDLIAVPDFEAGAMENWGLITFREVYLLYDKKSGSAKDRQIVGIVIAHEIAHQWFGNLVTMKWWNDLWLNEGFANYAENLAVDDYKKEWRILEQFASSTFQTALSSDSIINTHPISQPVYNPSEINEMFDSITYDKGSSVIRMLRSFLGDEIFRKGLQYYLNKYAYGNAEADDLWHAFSKVSGSLDVKAIMDSWIKQGGFPVINIQTSDNVNAVKSVVRNAMTVTQQRFFIDSSLYKNKKKSSSVKNALWHIPLTYITERSSKEQLLWMNTTDVELSLGKPGWFKANVDQMGFYRVNYDSKNWYLLTSQLMNDHNVLTAVDRSGLMDDAFALASAGYVEMTIPLKLTQYLSKEREYFPWSTALDSLAHIGEMISYTEAYDLHQKYLVKKLKPLEMILKWEDKGPVLDRYLRNTVLFYLCKHGDEGCIDICQDLFTKFVDNDSKLSISPHLRKVVYSTVTKNGGKEEWNFLWSKYEKENDATHQRQLMTGLANTDEPWLLTRLMQYALDGYKIRGQDMVNTITYVSLNLVGRPLAWDFFKENFEKIVKKLGKETSELGSLLEGITMYFNTDEQLDEVNRFIEDHRAVLGEKRASKKAVENIRTNINWMKSHYKTVHKWLKQVNDE